MEKVTCRWWKLRHVKMPYRYNGTHYETRHECTKPTWCAHNVVDAKMGGCLLGGDVTEISEEDRP